MTTLRSLLFNLLFGLATLGLGIVLAPLLFGPRSWSHAAGRVWARCCTMLLRWIVGLRYEVRGAPPKGAALVAAKHQSTWETLVLTLILHEPAFIMKRSLLFTPPFGIYLWRAGMIGIDRSAGGKAIRQMLEGARRVLAEGRAVLIFPEGTRRAPGAPPAYHPGVAALYRGAAAPVYPAALNSGLFWGRNAMMKRPGVVIVEFLEPIPPDLERKAFMRLLEDRIETATRALVKEAEEARRVVVR